MSGVNSVHNENIVQVIGRVDGTASPASVTAGKGFHLTDTGSGDWLITLDRAYEGVISCSVTSETSGVCVAVGTVTLTPGDLGASVQILGTDQDDKTAAADAKFSFAISLEVEDA